ncbi:MAG TPA: beta-ketoacyl-ACP synthase II [Longimicrobiales bacterium]
MSASGRRVVVTGMGAVTPIGLGVPAFWAALLEGRSGAGPITRFDASAFSTRFACELKGFDPLDHMDRKLANRLDPYAQYAVAAAGEAVRDAGLDSGGMAEADRDRVGVIFGSGQGGLITFQNQTKTLLERGPGRLSPFFVPMMIPDMAAGVIAMEHGFRGPNHCVVSACATGNHNIADALMLIQRGDADVVVSGGAEAAICEVGVGGFAAARALSTRNDAPAEASRPFDAERDGFVMGEGAGALVLESLEHAERRGARVYAEVAAVGTSADAYHMTAPHPEGRGARLALERALRAARLGPDDVDAVNMHATSTTLGDVAECRAVRAVLGDAADRVTATSTKSMTGHMLGAAGAAEAIASVLSIVHGVVPPTINLVAQDPECDLPLAANAPVRRDVRVALSNAFGFGGHNTTLVLRRIES